MRKYTLLILAILFFSTNSLLAQESNTLLNLIENKSDFNKLNNITSLQREQNFVNNQQYTTITQIGNYNTVQSTTITTDSKNIHYTQYGDSNTIDVLTFSQDTNQIISQIGNQNNFTQYSYSPLESQSINVMQNGNKQNIEVFGENSMSKDMVIKMEASDKSLIIRNFN
ncbi:hypothetical protein LNQ81_15140 [Myroides sp. M-43]|uniref:hypothetical protein n=1 Tax=Myroides oncorhynchi TaxID=2893756 RepID=UPI001E44C162|nr:hypothetical protein [Myroides oncorhynchi]MCC9044010.1 hypothetical protein [Myroides oncorhynchi]